MRPDALHLKVSSSAVDVLRRRARALQALRAHFDDAGFLEADVPVLLPSAGQEPYLHPPAVMLEGLPSPMWLQTSPELPLKHLLCAGADRLYNLGPAFRAGREELSTHHQPQFSMLEWYEAGESIEVLVQRVRALASDVAGALDRPAPKPGELLDLAEAFRRWAQLDLELLLDGRQAEFASQAAQSGLPLRPQDDVASMVGRVMVDRIEPALLEIDGLVFLQGYPAALAALAQIDPSDPRKALRVEAYLGGVELANGYVELLEPGPMAERWAQERLQRTGPAQAPALDEQLLETLAAHPPAPCVGMALGVDRLLMCLLGATSLDQVLPLSLSLSERTADAPDDP